MAFTYVAANIAQAIIYAAQAENEMKNKSSTVSEDLNTIDFYDSRLNIGLSGDVESIRGDLLSLQSAVSNAKSSIEGARAAIVAADASAAAEIDYYLNNELNYLFKTDPNFTYYSDTNGELTEADKEYIKKYIRNILYSNDAYGGNQGQPLSDYKYDNTYIDIIKSYFPNMTDEEVYNYLYTMWERGCGYTATANYIFESYKDKPEQFEKDFGFPMFSKDENGQLRSNVNYLLTDIYCYSNKEDLFNIDNKYNVWGIGDNLSGDPTRAYRGNSNRGYGAGIEYRIDILESERYNQAGVKTEILEDYYYKGANFKDYDDEIKENLEKGNLISFDATNYTLYPADNNGNKKMDVEPKVLVNSPHAMTITGVNQNGDFIVSTWGEKYVLDPDSVDPNFGLNVMSFEEGDNDDK